MSHSVTASIPHFVPVEVSGIYTSARIRSLTTLRQWPMVAMVRMEMIIYPSVEIVRAMKPWPGADEHAVDKPFRTVIACGSTGIGWGLIIAVGAVWRRPDLDAHLWLRLWQVAGSGLACTCKQLCRLGGCASSFSQRPESVR
jgi:hypothetical protein